mmetsp:Transcript_24231/g.34189  ORF Transcript_24231/g.34189 Transcript_24231/m.34189 type:complete len:161 (-) Transcript_24231:34-516(-)
MGAKTSIPVRTPVPKGKIRLCQAGFTVSHHTGRAHTVINTIVKHYPDKYESWFFFMGIKEFKTWIAEFKKTSLSESDAKSFANHSSSPFCWFETEDGKVEVKGGRDRLCEWALATFTENTPADAEIRKEAETEPSRMKEAFFSKVQGTAEGSQGTTNGSN